MKTIVYEYANCATCRKALKYLDEKKVEYERRPIVEQIPTLKELKLMLTEVKKAGGSLRTLFNTSGQVYRELGVSEQLKAGLPEEAGLALLAKNGKLIKRPFLLTSQGATVGFDESTWEKLV